MSLFCKGSGRIETKGLASEVEWIVVWIQSKDLLVGALEKGLDAVLQYLTHYRIRPTFAVPTKVMSGPPGVIGPTVVMTASSIAKLTGLA